MADPSEPSSGPDSSELDLEKELAADPPRRDFLQKAGSVLLGGAIVGCPLAVGVVAISDPLIRGKKGGLMARLTNLDAVVPGGPPQPFKVVADKTDAWTTYKEIPLGLVYIQRSVEGEVIVFSASCPHAGCAVEYRKEGKVGNESFEEHYYCPCHESAFALDGSIASAKTPSLRGLDTLEIDEEKLAAGEVWVNFQRFKAGIAEREPLS